MGRRWSRWRGPGPSGPSRCSGSQDLPAAVRRAVQTALTPPTGPVFLSLPVDVQMEPWADVWPAICRPQPAAHDSIAFVRRWRQSSEAAEVLAAAKNPGHPGRQPRDRARRHGRAGRGRRALGAPVITESGTTHGRLAFPADHPLYGQGLPLWSPEVRERLKEYDVLLVVGMDLLAAIHLLRAVAADPRAHQARADRRRPLAARQELSASKSA